MKLSDRMSSLHQINNAVIKIVETTPNEIAVDENFDYMLFSVQSPESINDKIEHLRRGGVVIASASLAISKCPSLFFDEHHIERVQFQIGIVYKKYCGKIYFVSDANLLTSRRALFESDKRGEALECLTKRQDCQEPKPTSESILCNHVATGGNEYCWNEVGCLCENIEGVRGLFIYSDTNVISNVNMGKFYSLINRLRRLDMDIYYVWKNDKQKEWILLDTETSV
jgi:hypothetical protein